MTEAQATAALAADALGKRYGRKWALRDCDVSLPQGGVIALIGPNGAGKTTLLHLLIGLIRPTTGRVRLLGDELRPKSDDSLAKFGFVAQEHPLYRGFAVKDLLHLGRALNPGWDQAHAESRLSDLGIPLGQRAGHLSGGQQAQVALTMALAKRPQILVLDEPLASLDPVARRDFMATLMDAVAADSLTVLLSSHVVAELERVCDHVILLRDGHVELAGEIDDLVDSHRLLVGPRCADEQAARTPGLVSMTSGERHTNMLVKVTGGADLHPRWQPHRVSFEELILAYLERAPVVSAATGKAAGATGASR